MFYFVSSQPVLNLIRQRFAAEYPEFIFCGATSPPFGEWPEQQNDEFVRDQHGESRCTLGWDDGAEAGKVGCLSIAGGLRLPIGSIGAVVDFYAGTVKPSPRWIRVCGMEALYRLAVEPKRLSGRVLVSNVNFVRIGLWDEVLGFGCDRQ